MKQSLLFTKTRKETPNDETAINGKLLIQGGFIHKEMAGVYSYLPLGLRVLNNIERIVREEMNAVGAQEIIMATLHPSEKWKQTGGWDGIDVLFKIKSRTENDYALGQSEEEIVTPIGKEYLHSYKDLPLFVYQIGQKYRDELRAKSGIMRGREFTMKDMYSFHASQEDFDKHFENIKKAYLNVYSRCGLVAKATEASGGSFSKKISYEFMVLTDAGEDDILYCESCDYCINEEITPMKEGSPCPKCAGVLKRAKASEVGNVFDLGEKYARDFDFTYVGEDGTKHYPIMGCYGIGITRLMGVIVEKCNDERGILWPRSVAPFRVHLLALTESDAVRERADALYASLMERGVDVLYDDRREMSVGEKFADADLLGIPQRIVVSEKTLAQGAVEIKERSNKDAALVDEKELFARLA